MTNLEVCKACMQTGDCIYVLVTCLACSVGVCVLEDGYST